MEYIENFLKFLVAFGHDAVIALLIYWIPYLISRGWSAGKLHGIIED